MHQVRPKSIEANLKEPCPICNTTDWCFLFRDGSVACGRVDIPPDGWIRSSKKTEDDRPIFHPRRNQVKPRHNRLLPKWSDRAKAEDGTEAVETEIYFTYTETKRVCRRQWSDRREAYGKEGKKKKNKLVLPQWLDESANRWQWGRGPEPWPLYQISEVEPEDVLFFVGGEMAVNKMRSLGYSATCHQGGEGTYISKIVEELMCVGFMSLVIIPDNDEQGFKAAEALSEATRNEGIPTSVIYPLTLNPDAPEKWDVANWELSDEEARLVIESVVAAESPTCKDVISEEETAEEIERKLSQIVQIRNPALRILKERKLMAEYELRPRELNELKRYASRFSGDDMGSEGVGDLFSKVFNQSEKVAAGEIQVGVDTGYPELDRQCGGFRKGRYITIAARPGMGKSSLALCCAYNAALRGQKAVLFSYEMPKEELMYRLISMLIEVEADAIATGNLSPHQWNQYARVAQQLQKLPLVFCTPPLKTIDAVETELENHRDADIVFIDYLQLMTGPGDNPVDVLKNITRELKSNAVNRDLPFVVLSQLNRELKNRSNKRPIMTDLRGSGSIEEDSDTIIFIYREEEDDKHCADRGIAEINVVKNRGGRKGTIKLVYQAEYTRFRPLADMATI